MKTTRIRNFLGMALIVLAMLCAAGCTKPDDGGNNGGGGNGGNGGNNGGSNGTDYASMISNACWSTSSSTYQNVSVSLCFDSHNQNGSINFFYGGDGLASDVLSANGTYGISGNVITATYTDVKIIIGTGTTWHYGHTFGFVNGQSKTVTYTIQSCTDTRMVVKESATGETLTLEKEGTGGSGGGNGGGGNGGGNNSNLPVVTTDEVTHIKHNSARCGGNVTADGGSTVTARGICWSRHSGTTLDDNVIRIGSGLGEFTIIVTDLNPTTTYYVRAYATNSTGTNYGEEFSFTTTETPEPNPPAPTGAVNGLFSVSPTKQVWFSQGNLQYQASTSTWRFATNSYDYVGGKSGSTTYGTVSGSSNNNTSSTYSGWIDLFGWGTSGWNNGNQYYHPYDVQITNDAETGRGYGPTDGVNYDYDLTGSYANSDWGMHNAISNGGNQSGLWRSLTIDECYYLLNERSASAVNGVDDARYARITISVGSKKLAGTMLFPDEYTHPQGVELPTVNSINVSHGYGTTYSIADWRALQEAGCVFLPPAGSRTFVSGKISYNNNGGGDACYAVAGSTSFWTSSSYTYYDENGVAYNGTAFTYDCSPSVSPRIGKWYGHAVRLVQDRQ